MNIYFIYFICFVIAQRLLELVVAKRNEKWIRKQGALEYGQKHYPYIVLLHILFIVAMITEYFFKGGQFNEIFMILFLVLILSKIWIIYSLGKYWNTKILRIPHADFVKKGPYKIFKHPNYFIVICEIFVIPFVFNLYITAITFSVLNAIMLMIRIKQEERVWATI